MRKLLLSIALIFTAGLAPATQPGDSELRYLENRLALLLFNYGANYPKDAKALLLEGRIAQLEALDGQHESCAGITPADEPTILSKLKTELTRETALYGARNPSVLALQDGIAKLEAGKPLFDKPPPPMLSTGQFLLELQIKRAAVSARFGSEASELRAFDAKIQMLLAKGAKFSRDDVSAALARLTEERRKMVENHLSTTSINEIDRQIEYVQSIISAGVK